VRQPDLHRVAYRTGASACDHSVPVRWLLQNVGVVPAVKPAASISRRKRIGVLATSRTVSDPYLDRLIFEYARECTVVRYAGKDIVHFVETRITEATAFEKDEAVKDAVEFFKREGVDALVLGCTHFLFLKDRIALSMGPGVEIIDSVEGVARQVERLAATLPHPAVEPVDIFYSTDESHEPVYRKLSEQFGLQYCGIL